MTPSYQTSFFFKLITCVLVASGVCNSILMLLEVIPQSWLTPLGDILNKLFLGAIAIGLTIALGYSFWWHQRERQQKENGLTEAFLQGFIRYWLAFGISAYGFAKIFKTQFTLPEYQLDTPMGEVSGFDLTWYYFGYSYPLAVIIALFQIGGSMLLLYRRTTLLGTVILLPVLFNIVLINLFFDIAIGAFINASLFTLALSYLLLNDFAKLKAAFWDLVEKVPAVRIGHVKHLLRLVPIASAFGLIYYFISTDKTDKALIGTWEVKKFIRNGDMVPTDAWQKDPTVVARIYFARGSCTFSPNPQVYQWQQALRGSYTFDPKTNRLAFTYYTAFSEKPDSLIATLSQRTINSMVLEGILRKDTIRLELTRLERKR